MDANGIGQLANYGLAGVIFLSMVIPLATLIYKGMTSQLAAKEAEIARMRDSEERLRKTMEGIAPALIEQARVVQSAIAVLNERMSVMILINERSIERNERNERERRS